MSGLQEQGGGAVDLAAVARDADLLDRLAVRAPVPDDDAVARLLLALASDVDEGLDAVLAELEAPLLEQEHGATPGQRRGHGLRASTVAIVVGATLSVSGVAAAVTGDPLSPYKGILHAVTDAGVPSPHASSTAALDHLARGTSAKIAHGDLDGARADIAALQSAIADPSVSDHDRALLQARLRNLMRQLAAAEAKDGSTPRATAKTPHTAAPHRKGPPSSGSTHPSHDASTATHKPRETEQPGGGGTSKPTSQSTSKPSTEAAPVTTPQAETTASPAPDPVSTSRPSHAPRGKASTGTTTDTTTDTTTGTSHGRSAG